jgi:lipoprotein-releasing system permease protein
MNIRLILSIAWKHLITRKRQTIVASLGVMFGIGTYVIMMSFMTGLNGLLDGMILNRTPHVRLYNEVLPSEIQPMDMRTTSSNEMHVIHSIKPQNKQPRIYNALAMLDYLNDQPQVLGAIPQVKAQGFYLGGSVQLSGILLGINPEEENRLYNLGDYVVEGNTKELARNESGIILGAGVASKLALKLGDYIQLASPSGSNFRLKIVGIYQSGLADIDNVQSYVNLKMAQRIMGEQDNFITDIQVKLHDLNQAPELAKKWSVLFGVNAVDIQTANAQFETGTSVRNLISYAVSITLLIVAGFGIYNILNMLIYEKMNDIAILKATGFSGRDVQTIFMSQAIIIGIIGGFLGLFLGFFGSYLISVTPFETEALPTIKTYPVNFSPSFYVIGTGFALFSTFMAGYFPSRRAAKIDPVDIIRGQ